MENVPEKRRTKASRRKRSSSKSFRIILICLFAIVVCGVSYIVYHAVTYGIGLPVSSAGKTVTQTTQMNATAQTEPTETQSAETEPTETEPLMPEELVSMYMENMTLEEKVWQMLIVTPTGLNAVDGTQHPVGGLYFAVGDLTDVDLLADDLFAVQATAEVPILFGVAEEGGSIAPLSALGLTDRVAPMRTYGDAGDTEAVYQLGQNMGQQIVAAGFHFNLAPVADTVNWYPSESYDLTNRTFGTDANVETVSQMVSQMVEGMQESGTIACLKHFPNLGSTAPSDAGDFSWLQYNDFAASDFLPFRAGIEAGVEMILVSDMMAPNLTGGNYISCCMSETVVTNILRTELGFEGVILSDDQHDNTDAEDAVAIVQAGCDVVFLPSDPQAAVAAILAAVENGTLTEERIEESVYRILLLKCEYGIITE